MTIGDEINFKTLKKWKSIKNMTQEMIFEQNIKGQDQIRSIQEPAEHLQKIVRDGTQTKFKTLTNTLVIDNNEDKECSSALMHLSFTDLCHLWVIKCNSIRVSVNLKTNCQSALAFCICHHKHSTRLNLQRCSCFLHKHCCSST